MFVSFKPADTSVLHSDIIMVMFFSHLLPDIERETLELGKLVRLGRNQWCFGCPLVCQTTTKAWYSGMYINQ